MMNIGAWEVRQRSLYGWLNLALSIVVGVFVVLAGWPREWRLVTVLPIFFSSIGFLQAGAKFCTGYGLRGMENFGESRASCTRLSDEESVRESKSRSYRLILAAFLIALATSSVFYAARIQP